MSRRTQHNRSSSGFVTKLVWTVLFGVIFGAGLITGQRLLNHGASPTLVSVEPSSQRSGEPSEPGPRGAEAAAGVEQTAESPEESSKKTPTLSFYERLSEGMESAAGAVGGAGPGGADSERDGAKEAAQAPAARYTLQVSAHPDRDRARDRLRRLRKMGLDPYLVSAELPEKGTYYRVRIGKFRSMKSARTFKRELERKRGVESAVTPL